MVVKKTKKKVAKKTATKKAVNKTVAKKAVAKKTAVKKATATAKATGQAIRVTLIKSTSGRLARHKACVRGLGLRRMHHSVEVQDTPCNRGMINKVLYMLKVEG